MNPSSKTPAVKEEPKPKPLTFFKYLWQNPLNKKYLLAALLINFVMFVVYKYIYPLPDFCSDAHSYIHAAIKDNRSYYRPFGYSRFLQFMHEFTSSHYFTVATQYLIIVLAAFFSFFSIDYLYPFRNKKIKFSAWLLVTVNPCLLFLANLMLADGLFVALSTVWFTLLLWIIRSKKWWCLVLQLLFLYWSFQLRYNALYYPVIVSIVFLLFPGMKVYYRFAGIAASFLLIFSSYTTIKKKNNENTGANVFAGFSGWQIANNALLIYKKADTQSLNFEEYDLKLLDKFVKHFIDSISQESKLQIAKGGAPSTPFLWDPKSPLKKYVYYYEMRNKMSYWQSWYNVSTLYNDYGWHIIKNNPTIFFKDYILPNAYEYLVPSMEFMEPHVVTKEGFPEETISWFDMKNLDASAPKMKIQEKIIYPYPVIHFLLLAFCLIIPVLYVWSSRKAEGVWKLDYLLPVLLWYLFIMADMAFSIFASLVVFRYVAILFIIGFGLPFYFLDQFIYQLKNRKATVSS